MLRHRGLAGFALLLVCGASHAFAQAGRSPLISEIQAQRNGLTRAWFAQLQMDSNSDQIQTIQLYDGRLIAQTRRGVIQLMDSETGKTFWSLNVGSSQSITSAPGVNAKYVAVTNGSTLYVYNRENGSLVWKKRTVKAHGAGLALSDDHAYLATTWGILEVHDLEDPAGSPWKLQSGGHGFVQPLATTGGVSWGTDGGHFYVVDTDRLKLRFWIDAQDEIVAEPAYIPPNLYFGSSDGSLYKVHEHQGTITWRFSTGEPIVHRPVAVDGLVFFTTKHGGLYCVWADLKVVKYAAEVARRAARERGEEVPKVEDEPELEEGSEVWWTPGIRKLVAISPTRVYGLDKDGHLRILRRDTGAQIAIMPTENQTLSVINHTTDRIYLGTTTGLIQCLHERALEQPLQYALAEPVKDIPLKIEQGGVEDEPGIEEPQDVEDLFSGGDEDDNPLGEDDNPFGEGDSDGEAEGDGEGEGDSPIGEGGEEDADDDNPFG